MSGSVNKVIIIGSRTNAHARDLAPEAERLYVEEGMSLPQIGARLGIPPSTVRLNLLRRGVTLRTRADAVRAALSARPSPAKGKQRPPRSDSWKSNLRQSRQAWADANALGHRITSSGYVEFTRGPNKGRCEHVVNMEQSIGRPLAPNEVVHHVNGIKTDNRLDNLALMDRDEHTRLHRILRAIEDSMEAA